MQGRVLIIAGSDSGGGAGIQADLKTVTALDAYASTAITAITVQNTLGVQDVHPVPSETIAAQIEAVLTDIGADVIKTGMLASTDVVTCVADVLDRLAPDIPRVVDPVMVAKGGHKLIADDAIAVLTSRLIKGASVITPNLPEAAVLIGKNLKTVADMDGAADALRKLGADSVVLKGGHAESDDVTDLLVTRDQVQRFSGSRIDTTSTHGTGCTLASAIAASLAQGLSLPMAVERARAYVLEAIRTAPGLGRGHGPLNHAHTVSLPLK